MMDTRLEPELVTSSGRFIHPYAVVWLRRLPVDIDTAWQFIATADGLTRWWIVPPQRFELEPGGAFDHHWLQVVDRFETKRFVQFGRATDDPVREVMRFELREAGTNATDFCFIDTWAEGMTPSGDGRESEQPGGPGTPWVGVLVGWHQTVDRLSRAAGAPPATYTEGQLIDWYSSYLNDQLRWRETTARPPR